VPEPIKLPGLNLRRLWKVVLVDDIDRPMKRTALLVRKCETVFQVLNEVKKTPGWELFSREHQNCTVASVELAGVTEN
jgi:hypothetical protein